MNDGRMSDLRRFMLEEILESIRKKAREKEFEVLEISTDEKVVRIPLQKITGLAFIDEK